MAHSVSGFDIIQAMNEKIHTRKGVRPMGILNDPREIKDAGVLSSDEAIEFMRKFPQPRVYTSDDEIRSMTLADAYEVFRAVRRELVAHLLYQEHHEHLGDDCGDDMTAATDNWNVMWAAFWETSDEECLQAAKDFLLARQDDETYPWGACDGEIRYKMLSEELRDKRWG